MSPSRTSLWPIRAVQLDLARQRETLETIERFIRFARAWGFNTVVLYLEGVVRTPSFPYRPADQSYDADDVRRLVAAARRARVDLVPCVSTLAHAEHFLTCPELAHLREPDVTGVGGYMFSPTNPETYRFLEAYLSEIAALFPSPHLHIGCDEAWGLGSGEASQARLKAGQTLDDLFVEHVRKVHAICTRLGKRAWIWDDMLENAPEEKFAQLPRDVVMCYWHYPPNLIDVDGIQGHFNSLRRHDFLALYERLGFDALVCPSAALPRGVLAHTRYAREHKVWGGYQTSWELGCRFLPGELPGMALAGWVWSHPDAPLDQALYKTLARLLPDVAAEARPAVALAMEHDWPLGAWPLPFGLLRGPLSTHEAHALTALELAGQVLQAQADRLRDPFQRDILTDLLIGVRTNILFGRLRQLLADTTDPRIRHANRPAQKAAARWCRREMRDLARLTHDRWLAQRPGIAPIRTDGYWTRLEQGLTDLLDQAGAASDGPPDRALLVARLFLWECYSAPRLRIELLVGEQARTVFDGQIKPSDLTPGHYDLRVPLRWSEPTDPVAIRFTVWGFGGQGISYVSLAFADRTLVPEAVVAQTGLVQNAQAVLVDDAGFAFLGSPDTVRTLQTLSASQTSTLEVRLRRG